MSERERERRERERERERECVCVCMLTQWGATLVIQLKRESCITRVAPVRERGGGVQYIKTSRPWNRRTVVMS